jgi:hypothetical protein
MQNEAHEAKNKKVKPHGAKKCLTLKNNYIYSIEKNK